MISTDRAVRADIEILVRAMAVTQALTDVAQMRAWWGVEHGLVEERADGIWSLSWNLPPEAGGHSVLCGTIRSLRHSSHLHVQRMVHAHAGHEFHGPVAYTFEARERGTSTHLSVLHEGFGTGASWEAYRDASVEQWPRDLARLKAFLERPR
ncbi:MAG: SRPBCC domain-containing protein [Planctomycetes bacterium]|nr:SRPBCC domain-containing protein [Planctomycetota bacterium]